MNPVVTRMRTAPIETAQPGLGRVEPDILDFPVGRRLPSVSAGALAAEGGKASGPRERASIFNQLTLRMRERLVAKVSSRADIWVS